MPRGVTKTKDGGVGKGNGDDKKIEKRSRKMRGEGGTFKEYCEQFVNNIDNKNNNTKYKNDILQYFKMIRGKIVHAPGFQRPTSGSKSLSTSHLDDETKEIYDVLMYIEKMIPKRDTDISNAYIFDEISIDKLINVLNYIQNKMSSGDNAAATDYKSTDVSSYEDLCKKIFFLKIYKLFEEFTQISNDATIDFKISTEPAVDVQDIKSRILITNTDNGAQQLVLRDTGTSIGAVTNQTNELQDEQQSRTSIYEKSTLHTDKKTMINDEAVNTAKITHFNDADEAVKAMNFAISEYEKLKIYIEVNEKIDLLKKKNAYDYVLLLTDIDSIVNSVGIPNIKTISDIEVYLNHFKYTEDKVNKMLQNENNPIEYKELITEAYEAMKYLLINLELINHIKGYIQVFNKRGSSNIQVESKDIEKISGIQRLQPILYTPLILETLIIFDNDIKKKEALEKLKKEFIETKRIITDHRTSGSAIYEYYVLEKQALSLLDKLLVSANETLNIYKHDNLSEHFKTQYNKYKENNDVDSYFDKAIEQTKNKLAKSYSRFLKEKLNRFKIFCVGIISTLSSYNGSGGKLQKKSAKKPTKTPKPKPPKPKPTKKPTKK